MAPEALASTLLCALVALVTGYPFSTPSPNNCHHLHHRIVQCLAPYEQLRVTYQAQDTTHAKRMQLRESFCYEYTRTLQCLHNAFLPCPPDSDHLNMVERRLGVWRLFMHETCLPPTPPRPPTTTTTTTTAAPTTTYPAWLRRTTYKYIPPKQKVYHHQEQSLHVTDQPQVVFLEDSHKNTIPLDYESDYVDDTADVGTDVLRIKGPQDCKEEDVETNQICALLLTSAAAPSIATPLCSLLLALLSWVLLRH